MLGSVVNFFAVIVGSSIGLLLKKGLSERIGNTIMNGLTLCILYIGFRGTLQGENVLIAIISIAVGSVIGEFIDLDKKFTQMGDFIDHKFKSSDEKVSISKGFVTASLLFCVGAMGIVGSLQSGLTGNHETLFTKSIIDGISALVLASSLGIGVLLSAAFVIVYEGSFTLLAQFISPYLTTTVINEMTCVGSLLIIGMSFNMLKITNLKIMNYVPAVFIPIILCLFM